MTPDRPPDDLRDLVGDDVPPEELAQLRRVDALLRSVPAPPPTVPQALTEAVMRPRPAAPTWSRPRVAAAVALAAALAALAFGLGRWTSEDGFEPRATVSMQATESAPGARAVLRLGERDATGNWPLELEVSGLEQLPAGGYYDLWLAKDGDYAGTCGTFNVGDDGRATVTMSASYRLADYDAWIVSAHLPGEEDDPPILLEAPIDL